MSSTTPRRLPDFIIAGAQKCGTTSLHRYLSAHPRLFLPRRPQELHYFDFDANFKKGIDWYAAYFVGAGNGQKIGQTSPLYLYDERVPARIAETLPDARIIVLLRDPVARAYSHYWHQVKKGTEHMHFAEALASEQQRIARDYDARRQYSYVDRGRYVQQLDRFARLFPRTQLLVLGTEALGRKPLEVLGRCFDFLGVEDLSPDTVAELSAKRFNEAKLPRWPRMQHWVGRRRGRLGPIADLIDKVNLRPASIPPMAEEARSYLTRQFADDNLRLAREFGFDTSLWGGSSRSPSPDDAGGSSTGLSPARNTPTLRETT